MFTWKQLHRLMRLAAPAPGEPELLPRYNVAPTQAAPVVRQNESGARRLDMMRWGLVPSWSKGLKSHPQTINARAEGAATSRVFREPLERRRCLVPVSGFFEWRKTGEGKRPHYIRRKDGEPFAFAGLWEKWSGEGGVESFAILTTRPNDLLKPLHDRMPVILRPEDYDLWLDPGVTDSSRVAPALKPYEGGDLEAYPVSTWVNSPAHDDAKCIQPVKHNERGLF